MKEEEEEVEGGGEGVEGERREEEGKEERRGKGKGDSVEPKLRELSEIQAHLQEVSWILSHRIEVCPGSDRMEPSIEMGKWAHQCKLLLSSFSTGKAWPNGRVSHACG